MLVEREVLVARAEQAARPRRLRRRPLRAAGAGAGAGGAAAGLSGLLASVGAGGLIAAGAVIAAVVIAAVVFIVNGNTPETTNTVADEPPAVAAPATPGGSDDSSNAGGIAPAGPDAGAGTGDASTGGTGTGTGDGDAGAGGTGTDTGAGTGTGGGGGTGTGGSTDTGAGAGTGGGTGGGGATGGTGGTGDGGTGGTDGGTGGTGGGDGGTGNGNGNGNGTGNGNGNGTGNGNGGETETPANLTITSSPQITGSLLAGGSATITATVNNDGQATSATQSISVQTPTGVTVSGIDATPQASGLRRAAAPAPITCNPANTCTAQFSVAGQSSVNVTVTITATRDATGGDASVQMLGQTFALPVTVGSPVTSLTGVADGTLFADDQVHRIQVTQTVANGGPEPITFTSTSPDVRFESCPPDEASGAAVSCAPDDGGEFSLAVVIGRGQSPGPLGDIIKVVDSAGRPLNLTGADGQPLQVVTPGPADLVLAEQFTVQQPVSGGSGSFTVTVRNAGGHRIGNWRAAQRHPERRDQPDRELSAGCHLLRNDLLASADRPRRRPPRHRLDNRRPDHRPVDRPRSGCPVRRAA